MLTQREKLRILLPKIKQHNYFEHGPYMITRKEAEAIIKAMEYHLKNLDRGHERYLEHHEENIKKAHAYYQQILFLKRLVRKDC